MNNVEKAQLMMTAFPGRSDCYGAEGGACIKMRLTRAVLIGHIVGKRRIGCYLLRRDGMIEALVVDMDEDNLYRAMEFRSRCQHYCLEAHVERSKSKGYHIWWFFSRPLSAAKARLVACHILDECEFPEAVEIFPKQDFLKPGGYGNFVNLPEFGVDVKLGRTVFLDPSRGYKPYHDQWGFLASRGTIKEFQLDEIIELNGLDRRPILQRKSGNSSSRRPGGMGLPCFGRILSEGVDMGMRNEAALRLAVGLYRTGVPQDLALVMLNEWNERNRPPLDYAELEKAISNGYRGVYGLGCFSRLIQPYCEPSCPIYAKHNQGNGDRIRLKRKI